MGNIKKTKSPTLKIEHRGKVYLSNDICRITGYSPEQVRVHMKRVLSGQMSMTALLRLRKKHRASFTYKGKKYDAWDICEITGFAINWASTQIREVLSGKIKAEDVLEKRKLDSMYKQCPKWRGLCGNADADRKKLLKDLDEKFSHPEAKANMDKYFPPIAI